MKKLYSLGVLLYRELLNGVSVVAYALPSVPPDKVRTLVSCAESHQCMLNGWMTLAQLRDVMGPELRVEIFLEFRNGYGIEMVKGSLLRLIPSRM